MSTDLDPELLEAAADIETAADEALAGGQLGDPATLPDRWHRAAELGWFAVVAPEGHDGLGLDPAALVGLVRSAGRHLVAGPIREHVLVAPYLLDHGDAATTAAMAASVAGTEQLAVAGLDGPVGLQVAPQGTVIDGAARRVPHAQGADHVVVLTSGDRPRALLIDADDPGLRRVERRPLHPGHAVTDLTFESVTGTDLGVDPDRIRILRSWARVLQAAWLTGVAEQALTLTLTHVGDRQQFGRVVGSFQAVQHTVADMAVDVDTMRNLTGLAAARLAGAAATGSADESQPSYATAALAHAGEAALRVCESALQMHGGIGFTTDYPLHRYYTSVVAIRATGPTPSALLLDQGRGAVSR